MSKAFELSSELRLVQRCICLNGRHCDVGAINSLSIHVLRAAVTGGLWIVNNFGRPVDN